MGSKLNPGAFDCYMNAELDEPMFVLLARDDRAPALVEAWADASEGRSAPEKVAEARTCAATMREWRSRNRRVTVCAACLQASCWQGAFYCDEAKTAGTVEKTVAQLQGMNLEHPDYWKEGYR